MIQIPRDTQTAVTDLCYSKHVGIKFTYLQINICIAFIFVGLALLSHTYIPVKYVQQIPFTNFSSHF